MCALFKAPYFAIPCRAAFKAPGKAHAESPQKAPNCKSYGLGDGRKPLVQRHSDRKCHAGGFRAQGPAGQRSSDQHASSCPDCQAEEGSSSRSQHASREEQVHREQVLLTRMVCSVSEAQVSQPHVNLCRSVVGCGGFPAEAGVVFEVQALCLLHARWASHEGLNSAKQVRRHRPPLASQAPLGHQPK